MNHRTITMRTIFDRATILRLLDEREFEHNTSLRVVKDGNPHNEHYLALFVYDAESQNDGTMLLRPVSTTVLGIQRFTTTRLRYQGVYVSHAPERDELLFETLRAHYRAAQQDLVERIHSMHGPSMRWTKEFPNGAGDLDMPFEFVIQDPDITDLNTLLNLRSDQDSGSQPG